MVMIWWKDKDYFVDSISKSHKRKPDFIPVMLPRKILKETAVTVKRYGIESSAHTATMANVINLSEGNI